MSFQIITADQRLQNKSGVKMVIFGQTGIGKTSLLYTLNPETTLCLDMEAGMLAVEDWEGHSIEMKTWAACRDIACLVGGPNPNLREDQVYSQAHYNNAVKAYGDPEIFKQYETFFFDSITVASRFCLNWCKGQPEASTKTGNKDMRGAYGLLGQELMGWLTQLQHTKGKNIIMVGILEEKTDEFNRRYWAPQIEGSKAANELPGIFDEVITLAMLEGDQNNPFRGFVCHTINPFGYPAKDRSGRLDPIEKPHLGHLLEKIQSRGTPNRERFNYTIPQLTT